MVLAFLVPFAAFSFFLPALWPFGLVLGGMTCITILSHTIFFVPEMQGLISLNILTKRMVPYGPGLHFRFFWEEVHRESNVSLEEVTETFTETFPTIDDAVEVEFSMSYRPDITNIIRFRAASASTIRDGLQGLTESAMASIVGARRSADMIGQEKAINEELREAFEETQTKTRSGKETLEERYGIDLTFLVVNRFKLSEEVRVARAALAEADALQGIMAKILGLKDAVELRRQMKKGLISKEALESARVDALVLKGEKVDRKIIRLEGDNPLGALIAAAQEVGGAARNIGNVTKNPQPKKGGRS